MRRACPPSLSLTLSLSQQPSLRHRCVAAALVVWAGLCVGARAADDALDQPRCLEARAELDAALQASAQDRRAHAQRLARAREQARARCLGGGLALPAPPARVTAQPAAPMQATPAVPTLPAPIATPQYAPRPASPATTAPTFTPAAPSAAAIPAPPPAIPTPRVLGHCDGTGCWDNLGNRLPQGGGMTSSPNGLCSVQGNFAVCP